MTVILSPCTLKAGLRPQKRTQLKDKLLNRLWIPCSQMVQVQAKVLLVHRPLRTKNKSILRLLAVALTRPRKKVEPHMLPRAGG